MLPADYFKLQANKLLKDCKTQSSYVDQFDGFTYYTYSPTFFDIDRIFVEYDWDEKNLSLMKAQHLFSIMVGFDSWNDLINAPSAEQGIHPTNYIFRRMSEGDSLLVKNR